MDGKAADEGKKFLIFMNTRSCLYSSSSSRSTLFAVVVDRDILSLLGALLLCYFHPAATPP